MISRFVLPELAGYARMVRNAYLAGMDDSNIRTHLLDIGCHHVDSALLAGKTIARIESIPTRGSDGSCHASDPLELAFR